MCTVVMTRIEGRESSRFPGLDIHGPWAWIYMGCRHGGHGFAGAANYLGRTLALVVGAARNVLRPGLTGREGCGDGKNEKM